MNNLNKIILKNNINPGLGCYSKMFYFEDNRVENPFNFFKNIIVFDFFVHVNIGIRERMHVLSYERGKKLHCSLLNPKQYNHCQGYCFIFFVREVEEL